VSRREDLACAYQVRGGGPLLKDATQRRNSLDLLSRVTFRFMNSISKAVVISHLEIIQNFSLTVNAVAQIVCVDVVGE
jgi:hypothetical protein